MVVLSRSRKNLASYPSVFLQRLTRRIGYKLLSKSSLRNGTLNGESQLELGLVSERPQTEVTPIPI